MMDFAVIRMGTEHLPDVAAVHLAAFEEYFLARMGHRFVVEYYRCYLDSPRALAYVALDGEGGDVLGFTVGAEDIGAFYAEAFSRHFWRLAWAAAVSTLESPALLAEIWRRRGAFVGPLARRLLKRPPAKHDAAPNLPAASWVSLGVVPAARKRGVAKALMLALLDELRRRAIPAVKLGVRADNVVACGFYERYGWECVCEHPTRSGAPGRTYVYRIDDRPGAGHVKG